MQFNSHVEKYTTVAAGGIHKEQFREYSDPKKYHNNVDPERTKLNVIHSYRDWLESIKNAKDNQEKITGKAVRKDAIVLCSLVQTVPASWEREAASEYFEKFENFMRDFLTRHGVDQEAELSAITHFDEDNPHQTYCWMPLQNGRFCNKKIMNKQFLRDLQKEGYEHYLEWSQRHPELERLEPFQEGNKRPHKTEAKYKRDALAETEKQLSEVKQAAEQIRRSIEPVLKDIEKAQLDKEERKVLQKISRQTPVNSGRKTEKGNDVFLLKGLREWFRILQTFLTRVLRQEERLRQTEKALETHIEAIQSLECKIDQTLHAMRNLPAGSSVNKQNKERER